MSYVVVIPARYASTRLPGKALADIAGKPMVQHVYERAQTSSADAVWIAIDDERIQQALKAYDSQLIMTSPDHPSGTDRLAEVVEKLALANDDILVNVQGDEPLIPAAVIDQVARNLQSNPDCVCATLSEPIETAEDFLNPAVVKVLSDEDGRALYFSRAPIPWPRDQMAGLQLASMAENANSETLPEGINAQRHIGIYAYRAGLLRQFVTWDQASLECTESLEQLRILAKGKRIHVDMACEAVPGGVDTPQDLDKVRALFEAS